MGFSALLTSICHFRAPSGTRKPRKASLQVFLHGIRHILRQRQLFEV